MRKGVRRSAWRLTSVAVATALLIAGCGLLEESPPTATPTPAIASILIDPGFETSDPPAWRWANNAAPFAPSNEIVRSGELSAALTSGTSTDSVAQTLNISEIPEFLSGYYRVDDWPNSGGAYIQFSVHAASTGAEPVHGLRFIIAGAADEPEPPPSDVRYVFLNRDPPILGEWTYFAYPLREAFIVEALAAPSAFPSLDISLQVGSADGASRTTVYFDDLYVGPQASNPNRPRETRE